MDHGVADYYLHLAKGQGRVVLKSVPISRLQADQLDSLQRTRLELVAAIRSFAVDSLGLSVNDNYTAFYDTKGLPISWNVSASPPDRLEPFLWSFPLVGALPYIGFFVKDRALAERHQRQKAGYEAVARPVSAYSTLGYLADPVLSSMLDYSPARLADLILHESTHATIYIEDHTDYNESLASFVGRQGSLNFLKFHYGPDTPLVDETLASRADQLLFAEFMGGVVARLDSLYTSKADRQTKLGQRQLLFEQAKEEYRILRPRFGRLNYDVFLDWELNNARLLSYKRYNRGLDDFASVLAGCKGNLRLAIGRFVECGAKKDPWACLRDTQIQYSP